MESCGCSLLHLSTVLRTHLALERAKRGTRSELMHLIIHDAVFLHRRNCFSRSFSVAFLTRKKKTLISSAEAARSRDKLRCQSWPLLLLSYQLRSLQFFTHFSLGCSTKTPLGWLASPRGVEVGVFDVGVFDVEERGKLLGFADCFVSPSSISNLAASGILRAEKQDEDAKEKKNNSRRRLGFLGKSEGRKKTNSSVLLERSL